MANQTHVKVVVLPGTCVIPTYTDQDEQCRGNSCRAIEHDTETVANHIQVVIIGHNLWGDEESYRTAKLEQWNKPSNSATKSSHASPQPSFHYCDLIC